MAPIPTSAATRTSTPTDGSRSAATEPRSEPRPPPNVKRGASVPPDVPLPSAMDQETNFIAHRKRAAPPTIRAERRSSMLP